MRIVHWPAAWLIALALMLALGFLGSRGIWDPDEGRYTNVALTMLENGDWVTPMRNENTAHWTKPPVTYWLVASSVAVLGRTPWAARLPIALAYLACIWLTWRCARRLLPGAEATAAIVYATMLLPFGAAQLVTTDFPLAAAQGLAMYAFVEYRFGNGNRPAWLLLMWVAFAIAFMTKGPPALVPLLAVAALHILSPADTSIDVRWHVGGVLIFIVLALPWFVVVAVRHDGLMQYFLGAELVDRVASNKFGRNGEWYGWAKIYLPTLILGTLPWTRSLWHWVRTLPASFRRWGDQVVRRKQAELLLVALWIIIPLTVFCIARSRLPLYVLPIFVPVALAISAQRKLDGCALPRGSWLATWVVILLALRLAAAHFPTHKNAAAWAEALRSRSPGPIAEVVFVEDMARYGLHLHLDAEIEKLSRESLPQSRIDPEFDEPLIREVEEHESGLIYVAKQSLWPDLQRRISGYGYTARQLGSPYEGRVIFEVLPPEHRDRTERLNSGD
jgi:4-amino-4-deoxy-L-arabinose transferase-like glycosyltransferase